VAFAIQTSDISETKRSRAKVTTECLESRVQPINW